jgi:hypothetical protein
MNPSPTNQTIQILALENARLFLDRSRRDRT